MRDELPRKKERKTAVSRLAFQKMNSYKKLFLIKIRNLRKQNLSRRLCVHR